MFRHLGLAVAIYKNGPHSAVPGADALELLRVYLRGAAFLADRLSSIVEGPEGVAIMQSIEAAVVGAREKAVFRAFSYLPGITA